jgi:transcription-repair coupling factor (superfamily II helicase)
MEARLEHLTNRWVGDPLFRDVIASGGDGLVLPDAVRPFFLAGLAKAIDALVVAVAPTGAEASELHAAVREFLPQVGLLDAWDVLPYEGLGPDPRISAHRMEALALAVHEKGARIVVTSARGLMQKPAPGAADVSPIEIRKGAEVDRDGFVQQLVNLGYAREAVASEPGTFAVRGGIVDVFPGQAERVVRIELDFDAVASMRWVDPESQRTIDDTDHARIVAAAEVAPTPLLRERATLALERVKGRKYLEDVADKLARLADGGWPTGLGSLLPRLWHIETDGLEHVLPGDALLVLLDPKRTSDEASKTLEHEEELAALWADPTRLARDPDDPGRAPQRIRDEDSVLHMPLDTVVDSLRTSGRDVWRVGAMAPDETVRQVDARGWDPGLAPRELLERCRALRSDGYDLVFCALPNEAAGVGTRLAEENLAGSAVVASHLRGGFFSPPLRLAVITHTEWHARPPAPARSRRQSKPRVLGELDPGDLVVHALHGIGRYVGMETRDIAGFTREYLLVEYAAGDRLFVPSDSTDSLQRYIGSEQPALSRLGTADWERTKARVRKKVRDIAADLIRLYSARLHSPGHAYPLDSPWIRELEESFPFEETPDQLRTIEDVHRDLARPIPMDRLVCGDVGFGKTEVAVRAAFTAVVEGKQVAVLVPTTLLAQQHFQVFSERFAPFPVKVAMLSRFVDVSDAREVIEGVEAGTIDVVIGTHRLLSKDVRFKDLGLIVVDEEHRFGVAQKEQLRKKRVEVDVLTLTATPIPRTLEMSMASIRDLSVIDTPPLDRHPVRTFVGPYEERLVAAAIRRELARNGQVFVVHNRIQTIERELARLQRLVPEARIAIGHGQMPEHQLERVMVDFWNRDVDVLLCTTIIEAGLDIPTSNTLIVDHADKLGLAQLYQLRGRVGRAHEQAYAYLFYPSNIRLTPQAHERLKTLARYSELGSGMAIALKDLEIRGAGNLLGAEQHGHIEAVGFEMYVKLLEEAARELRDEEPAPPAEVRIDLPVDAFLPTTYIELDPLRLAAYRRIADTTSVEEVRDAMEELRDRYGPLPSAAQALGEVAELRAILRNLRVTELVVAPHELHGRVAKVRPMALPPSRQVRLSRLYPRAVYTEATETVILPVPDADGRDLVRWLREALEELLELELEASTSA